MKVECSPVHLPRVGWSIFSSDWLQIPEIWTSLLKSLQGVVQFILTSADFPHFLTKHGIFQPSSWAKWLCHQSVPIGEWRGRWAQAGEEGEQRGCCLLFSCRVCLTANWINETPGIDAINYFAVETENYIMKRLFFFFFRKKKSPPKLKQQNPTTLWHSSVKKRSYCPNMIMFYIK